MPGFYQQADILVLPSRARRNWTEQFGRVLIEAMACEVAVVGSSTGEIPHVIGEAGRVFPEDDVSILAEILSELVASASLRQSLGRQGRERVLAQFTQEQVAMDTVTLYREILQC
jgi:glycosyltransferase involved in cell wall biosynthesis